MCVYVDDLVLVTNNEGQRTAFKRAVSEKFKMRDLGPINFLLGIKITRTPETLTLSQAHYVEQILRTFGMEDCNPNLLPLQPKLKLHDDPEGQPTRFPYRECIGALQFLASCTRPDIIMPVSVLATHSNHATDYHTTHLKGLCRYLQHTKHFVLTYHRNNEHPLFAACDASHLSEGLRSRCGHCLIRGGAAVSWRTWLNKTYVDNTAEAEYYSACTCTKALLFARELKGELGWHDEPTKVQIDNNATCFMALDASNHKRSKHIPVKSMVINQAVERAQCYPEHIDTDLNPADIFTKPLPQRAFERHRAVLMGIGDNDQFSLSTPVIR